MGFGGFGDMMGFGGYWMLFGSLIWIGLVVLVVWVAVSLLSGRREGGQETPLGILKRRYAAGELSSAEYQQASKDLS